MQERVPEEMQRVGDPWLTPCFLMRASTVNARLAAVGVLFPHPVDGGRERLAVRAQGRESASDTLIALQTKAS